jgi:OmpA-OmpF porin, OOP family
MRKYNMTSLFLACSVLVGGAALGGCSKDKKAKTMPEPTEVATETTAPGPQPSEGSVLSGDQVFFAFDSAELTGPGKSILDDIAAWVTTNSERSILVRGHADKAGGADYNLDLSSRRAAAVGAYLKSRGVGENQLILAAVGETMADLEPSGANRRVVIYATAVESSMR